MTCHVAPSINVRCSLVVTKGWKGQLSWVHDESCGQHETKCSMMSVDVLHQMF